MTARRRPEHGVAHLTGGERMRRITFLGTAAATLLLGAAVGLFWTPNRLRPHGSRRIMRTLDLVACQPRGVAAQPD